MSDEFQSQLGVPRFNGQWQVSTFDCLPREREFFIDNLLVRIHLIVEMILVDWLCAMGVGYLLSR